MPNMLIVIFADYRTPLHVAESRKDWTSVVQYLLDHGADPSLIDSNDRSVLHVAVQSLNDTIVGLLLKDKRVVKEVRKYLCITVDLFIF